MLLSSLTMNFFKSKLPLLRPPRIRLLSTNCPPAPLGGISDYEIATTTLPNNLTIASAENGSIISRISIVYRAGARYETPDIYGLTHTLSNCALLSTKNSSQFAINSNLMQSGASISCTTTRELVAYTLQGTRRAIEKTLPFLTEVATQHDFRPHEVRDNAHCLGLHLEGLPPRDRIMDLVHKAAFRRGGLGNSLYIQCYNVGNISTDNLEDYVDRYFTTGRAAVVALGVDHASLSKYASTLHIPEGEDAPPPRSPYRGGEIRIDEKGDRAVIAVAFPAPPLEDTKGTFAACILKHVLFGSANVYGGVSRSNLLAKETAEIDTPFQISPFCEVYSDEGLIGVVISSPGAVAGRIVEAAVGVVRNGKIHEEDFERMKNQVMMSYASRYESASFALDNIRKVAVAAGCGELKDILEAVESVSVGDVEKVLKKAEGSAVSMAAVGDLRSVPYLDELNGKKDEKKEPEVDVDE